METLTAFVRERARPEVRDQRIKEGAYFLWKDAGSPWTCFGKVESSF